MKKALFVRKEFEKICSLCIIGDQSLFVSSEEVNEMWRFIDPIITSWKRNDVSLKTYAPDTQAILDESKIVEEAIPLSAELTREIGYIGLGKMGKNMSLRLLERGWNMTVFDTSSAAVEEVTRHGAKGVDDVRSLVQKLSRPRVVWIMVPAYIKNAKGSIVKKPVDDVLFGRGGIVNKLSKGDIVIDGGNSFYEDSIRRGKRLKKRGIHFLDAGISGGPGGARSGASIMVGGEKAVYKRVEHLFKDLAVDKGYGHMGSSGAGHFVKMVHNGIEYGMMQSIAEGFELMKESPLKLKLKEITEVYNHGSVVESRLIGWLQNAFKTFGENLKGVSGSVAHTGEGEWTVKTAKKMKVPTPIMKGAFDFRVKSEKNPSYTGKVLSALRNMFGGHSIQKQESPKGLLLVTPPRRGQTGSTKNPHLPRLRKGTARKPFDKVRGRQKNKN